MILIDINKLLAQTLNSDEILNLTADKKVYFLHANNPKIPYIEYEVISETGDEFSEGKEDYTKYLVQIDIFDTGNYTKLAKTIKEKMISAGFNRDQAVDLYEDKKKLNHKAMRFNISLPY